MDRRDCILRLANGDMRRVLNILQSTALAYDTVNEANVCASTGTILPADIVTVMHSLMNDGYAKSLNTLTTLSVEQGLAISDLLTEIAKYVNTLDLPSNVRAYLMQQLADAEYRLSFGTQEDVQRSAVVAAFICARNMVQRQLENGNSASTAMVVE